MDYMSANMEDNYRNIRELKAKFKGDIENFKNEYNRINYYNSPSQLVVSNLGYEYFAYRITAYTQRVYAVLVSALNFWVSKVDTSKGSKSGYDKAIYHLAEDGMITDAQKEALLKFRLERNVCAHSAEIYFSDYIFKNDEVIYVLICKIEEIYRRDLMKGELVCFYNQQNDYIKDMNRALGQYGGQCNQYVVANPIVQPLPSFYMY